MCIRDSFRRGGAELKRTCPGWTEQYSITLEYAGTVTVQISKDLQDILAKARYIRFDGSFAFDPSGIWKQCELHSAEDIDEKLLQRDKRLLSGMQSSSFRHIIPPEVPSTLSNSSVNDVIPEAKVTPIQSNLLGLFCWRRFSEIIQDACVIMQESFQKQEGTLVSEDDFETLTANDKRLHDLNQVKNDVVSFAADKTCLLYTSPSPRDLSTSRMPSSA